jgi:aminocarboxymuconate-semialdehyde decarboxylase
MTTRRNFLRSVAAATPIFCSCCLLDSALAQQPKQHRRLVSVGGQRVRTVDTHCHCLFQDAIDPMGADAPKALPPTKGVAEHFIGDRGAVLAGRLRAMDEMGIDMQILSVNPYWYDRDRETAVKIVDLNNSHLAALCAEHPDRFGAFAALTMQFPDLAVQQLDDAVRNKGLHGAAIGASMLGESFALPKYDAVWAKAEELGATLFIHPQGVPELSKRIAGNGWLGNIVAYPVETTIALQHFIFEGTLDKFPKLKVLGAHGGGYLPSYAPRDDHACFVSPQNCNPNIVLKKKPTEYLNQMYFDSLVFTPEALRHLVAQVGASQIVIGTDNPIPWEDHPVDMVIATKTLSDAEKRAILGTNATRLLNLKT